MGRSRRSLPQKLPQKLYCIRLYLELTQKQMVDLLKTAPFGFLDGIPIYPTHISEYERGLREPPLVVLLRYARLADVSTDILIDDFMLLPQQFERFKFVNRPRYARYRTTRTPK